MGIKKTNYNRCYGVNFLALNAQGVAISKPLHIVASGSAGREMEFYSSLGIDGERSAKLIIHEPPQNLLKLLETCSGDENLRLSVSLNAGYDLNENILKLSSGDSNVFDGVMSWYETRKVGNIELVFLEVIPKINLVNVKTGFSKGMSLPAVIQQLVGDSGEMAGLSYLKEKTLHAYFQPLLTVDDSLALLSQMYDFSWLSSWNKYTFLSNKGQNFLGRPIVVNLSSPPEKMKEKNAWYWKCALTPNIMVGDKVMEVSLQSMVNGGQLGSGRTSSMEVLKVYHMGCFKDDMWLTQLEVREMEVA